MRGETTPAGDEAPHGGVEAILDDLCAAADGEGAAEVLLPFHRGLAALLATYPQADQLSREDRLSLRDALFRAETAAKAVLVPSYYEQRGKFGFLAAFGLLNRWAEMPGSIERAAAWPEEPKAVLILRIVVNDFDTLCANHALSRIGFHIAPEEALLSGDMATPRHVPTARMH